MLCAHTNIHGTEGTVATMPLTDDLPPGPWGITLELANRRACEDADIQLGSSCNTNKSDLLIA